jgi:hypothetical protein
VEEEEDEDDEELVGDGVVEFEELGVVDDELECDEELWEC